MKFGSVCSGIEAASVAWEPLGWKAAWFSEIEPFPCAVLKHHYPDVPNLGDMTTLPDRILKGEVEAPDLFCGGTPCQAFSVAGLRKSLDDARGNLSLTFCEIANAIDSVRSVRGSDPCIVFWENVPGVLNTKDNAFGCFLAGLAGEGLPLLPPGDRWTDAGCVHGPQRTVAWRVLDAQYFGLAQRRRRVFVVASSREGFNPVQVLLEFDGVRRDSAPSREAGQTVAPTIAGCANGGGANGPGRDVDSVESLQPYTIANTLTARMHKGLNSTLDEGQTPIIGFDSYNHAVTGDVSKTLDVGQDYHHVPNVFHPVAFHPTQDPISSTELCHSIGANKNATAAVAVDCYNGLVGEVAQTLQHGGKGGSGQVHTVPHTMSAMQVRRLTPVECERLQGFPDNYTAIPWRGKDVDNCPDGPRYKALGNSWAVPVVHWIGRRIATAVSI